MPKTPKTKAVVTTTAKPMGRPTTYRKELVDEICGLLSEGVSMRTICRDPNMPAMSTIFKWLGQHPYFSEQYARAKEESADAIAEDIQELADAVLAGHVDPNAARVALDAKKWSASKLKPKKYGDFKPETSQTINFNIGTKNYLKGS